MGESDLYATTIVPSSRSERNMQAALGGPEVYVEVVETEIDLYYRIAIEMYSAILRNTGARIPTVLIVPVGPTFQYRRFVSLCSELPIDLSGLHLFFMDEYLEEVEGSPRLIDFASALSFRAFVDRELVRPLVDLGDDVAFRAEQVFFPDPEDPAAYDDALAALGGAEICFAGVGINGHIAFNEPPYPPVDEPGFFESPTRIVELSRETITINSNTALGGAWERIPRRAVTVGMKHITESRSLRVFLNRPWQRAVARKMLYGPVSAAFPASIVQRHRDARLTMTRDIASAPQFALR
ncbi:MAG: hypothetical protein MI724_06705 [Spirochaetales bacterium]|nr:hypothetical protein [Spirochaetales bacterium]